MHVCLVAFVACLAVMGAVNAQNLPPCTDNDIEGEYSRCLSLDGTRNLYYYYGLCDSTNAPAPPSTVEGLPCNIDCDPGYYLPLNGTTCDICDPGTFSLGGGARFYEWVDTFPKTPSLIFKTYCSDLDSVIPSDQYPFCGWDLNGYETNSGDLTGLGSVNSILELTVTLLEAGKVGFEYMCDVERQGDVLAYKLDDEQPEGLPLSAEFTYYSIDLPAGVHSLRWIFYKNPEISTGTDIARISFVEIYGIQAADDGSCTSCPPGYYQPVEGQENCIPCVENTYSPDYGTSVCLPCTDGYSFQGASECAPFDDVCSPENDVVSHYTPCEYNGSSWTRTQYFSWNSPLFCDSRGIDLPANVTDLECADCPPGSYLSSSPSTRCAFCNGGTYNNGNSKTCSTCEDGSVAIPKLYYTEWNEWPIGFDTFCYGECLNDGWQLYGDRIRGSLDAGYQTDLLLTVFADIGYGGKIEYDWNVHGDMVGSSFQVTVDGETIATETHSHGTNSYELSYGPHVIGFLVHGDRNSNAHVDITSITVIGTYDGGASSCTPCPPGYYQFDSELCLPCALGRYNDEEGATSCSKCPSDTYASRAGTIECVPCPSGSTSPKGSSYCNNPECNYESEDGEYYYNLSPYAGVPQFVDNEDQFSGYYLVSYCGTLYASDSDCTDSYICETFDKFNPFAPARNYINWAKEVTFEPSEDGPESGFSLRFWNGEATGCNEGNRTATVNFICAANPEDYTSLSYSSSKSTTCNAIFTQHTVYGCPVCSMDDFEREEGDCESGQMTVSYPKKKDSQCNGYVKDTVESCGDVSLNFGFVVAAIVLALLAFLLLLIVIIWVVLKNQRLQVKYTQLQSGNVEMDQIEEELDE